MLASDLMRSGDALLQLTPQIFGCRRRLNSLDQQAQLILHATQLLKHSVGVGTHNLLPQRWITAGNASDIAQTLASQHQVAVGGPGEAARDEYRHQVRQVRYPSHRSIMIVNVHDHLASSAGSDRGSDPLHRFSRRSAMWCHDPGAVRKQVLMGGHRARMM